MAATSHTPQDPRTAHTALRDIFAGASAGRLQAANEANTRLQIINRVLEALGWSVSEFGAETPTGVGDFIDYLLAVDGSPWLVVEAKRAGVAFHIPKPTGHRADSSLASMTWLLSKAGNAFQETAKQAARYCNDRGVPLACVTNGYQWVFFRGLSTEQRPWRKASALVFDSPDELFARFDDFWSALARARACTPHLMQLIDRESTTRPTRGERPYDSISIVRPRLDPASASFVRMACDALLGDIYGDGSEELLNGCYVEPGAKGDFERSIALLLKDSLATIDGDDVREGGTTEFLVQVQQVDRESQTGRPPIVVVGHVGAGKTTFLHRSIGRLRDSGEAFFAHVDLEGQAQAGALDARVEENRVADLIMKKLGRAALTALKKNDDCSDDEAVAADPDHRDTLRTILRREIANAKDLGADLWKADPAAWPREEYELIGRHRADAVGLLIKYIRHLRVRFRLKEWRYPVLIVLDNLDQASDEYQRCIYGLAQRVSRETPALVVVCLREDTYARGRESGGFLTSSLLQFVFHVRSPPIDRLIRERVRFGELVLQARGPNKVPSRLRGVLGDRGRFGNLLTAIATCLLAQKSEALELVAALAGHNMRDGLSLVRAVASGDLALGRRSEATAAYAVECFFAARAFSDATTSLHIVNIYEAEPSDVPAHALRRRLLAYYWWASEGRGESLTDERSDIAIARFSAWGYSSWEVARALHGLLRYRLLRSADRAEAFPASDPIDLPERLRITAAGLVHVRTLPNVDAYRSAMALLTSWYSPSMATDFVRFARAAGNSDGVTLGDVQCSAALATFDAYLAQMGVSEAALLSSQLQARWVSEVEGRTTSRTRSTSLPTPDVNVAAALGVGGERQLELATLAVRASPSLRPIRSDTAYNDSVWLPRILWALEWARLGRFGPVKAAEIARILATHSEVPVPMTNVARAFRDFRLTHRSPGLWTTSGKRYEITEAGTAVINAILLRLDQD